MLSAIFSYLKRFFPDISPEANICFDSRKCAAGDVFFAIKGNATDGRLFIQDVLDIGGYVVCDAVESPVDLAKISSVYVVNDVKRTISDLVSQSIYALRQNGCRCIAVTGSSGKTFTKNGIHKILSDAGYISYCTDGNYNTEFGILLSLTHCRDDLQYLILELGISKPGDMDLLASITRPDMCLILDVAHAHIANFGDRENLIAEKLKLAVHTSAKVVMHNNLAQYYTGTGAIFYNPDDVLDQNRIEFQGKVYDVRPKHIRGRHFLENLLGIATLLDGIVPMDKMVETFENIENLPGRGRVVNLINPKNNADFMLYDSSYNANPGPGGSMFRELAVLGEMDAPHKIAVLGQYGEIEQTPDVYYETLKATHADEIMVVGTHWPKHPEVHKIADIIDEDNIAEIIDMVLDKLQPHSILFVKGSNSNGLYQYFVPELIRICAAK